MELEKVSRMKFSSPLNCEPGVRLQTVEVATRFQIPSFQIVGLAGREVTEARERIRSAMEACEFKFPKKRVILNLAPADVNKRGTGADLAMALAVLAAGLKNPFRSGLVVASGELSLNGDVRPVGQMVRAVVTALECRADVLLIAKDDADSAADALGLIEGARLKVVPVSTLREAWNYIRTQRGTRPISARNPGVTRREVSPLPQLCFSAPVGRILGIAAAGGHHLLILGPRGTGKSQAIEGLTTLVDASDPKSRLQRELVRELGGGTSETDSPIRRVGIHARAPALVGGIRNGYPVPGEFSLAHGGLLICDELPEWSRDAREALREPLETGFVQLTRAGASVRFPAGFQLAATGNFCPCGELSSGSTGQRCRCSSRMRRMYLERLSGPVTERIDLVFSMESSRTADRVIGVGEIAEQAQEVRNRIRARWGRMPRDIPAEDLENILALFGSETRRDFERITSDGSLRSRHKILRVALTLAEWAGSGRDPGRREFLEAKFYRFERLLEEVCVAETVLRPSGETHVQKNSHGGKNFSHDFRVR